MLKIISFQEILIEYFLVHLKMKYLRNNLKTNYKIVTLIAALLIALSLSISSINYVISLKNAEEHLKNQSLPLSLHNIYTDIQKHIIEPYLVSSMMANDTFLKDWLINDEKNSQKVVKYLNTIKNKYQMLNTFLVSDMTKSYYTQNGFIEKIKQDNPANEWYFNFKASQTSHEINLDFNENLTNEMMMFINYKIYDINYQMIGVTGIALKVSYIDDMLKEFRLNHNFIVTFYNKSGEIILSEKSINPYENIEENKNINKFKDRIISKSSNLIEFEGDGGTNLIKTKYIPELDLYLSVEAEVNNLMKDVKKVFYFSLILSSIITIIITLIILFIIKKYHKRLTFLAEHDTLTSLTNRRVFEEKLNQFLLLLKRSHQPLSLIFLDIDDFKKINDSFGHHIGDLVLKRISSILSTHIRQTDIISRWGGEEFIIALIDTGIEEAKVIAEKLRLSLEKDYTLKGLINASVTASVGISQASAEDTIESLLQRADEAMYTSKKDGKNMVSYI